MTFEMASIGFGLINLMYMRRTSPTQIPDEWLNQLDGGMFKLA